MNKDRLYSDEFKQEVNGILIVNKNKLKTKIDDNGRVCTHCGEYKLWSEFAVANHCKLKKSSKCKVCVNDSTQKYHKIKRVEPEYREIENKTNKEYRKKLREVDPCLTKSRNLRQRNLTRIDGLKISLEEKKRMKNETPTGLEYYKWLNSLMVDEQFFICAYSGQKIDIYGAHVEHKLPLNRGGSNKIENLCISAPLYNVSKGSMTDEEFYQLLDLIKDWEDSGKSILSRLSYNWFGK